MVRHTGEDFIDVEGIAEAAVPPFQSACINGSELDTPEAYRFSGYSDASFGEQIFNIAMAEVETIVEPDSVADDVRWESVALVSIHAPILSISGSLLVGNL